MGEVTSANELAHCGRPIVYSAAMGAPDGVPEVGSYDAAYRTTVRTVSQWQKEAIVASTRSPQVWRLASDEGPFLNGHDFAPAPLAYLAAGLAADHANALGRTVGGLDGVELEEHVYFSVSGSMRRGDAVGAAHNPVLRPRGATAALGVSRILDSVIAAPSHGLVNGVNLSQFGLTVDGQPVTLDGLAPLDEPPIPDPGSAPLHPPVREPRIPEEMVAKIKSSVNLPSTVGPDTVGMVSAGTGPPRLHLQANCRVRPDGVKEIEVLMHHPIGSTFRFLSDEPVAGAAGRAPDAAALISAGIGFCFMTQFGRFAKMTKRQLGAYHVVQDTRFSVGDPATRTPGRADAVGTHVYVETDGDQDYAREAVRVSEQSCFLHALCRTDLRTKISL